MLGTVLLVLLSGVTVGTGVDVGSVFSTVSSAPILLCLKSKLSEALCCDRSFSLLLIEKNIVPPAKATIATIIIIIGFLCFFPPLHIIIKITFWFSFLIHHSETEAVSSRYFRLQTFVHIPDKKTLLSGTLTITIKTSHALSPSI